MSITPPSAGDPYRVPAAPSAYAAHSPSVTGAPPSGPPPMSDAPSSPVPTPSRPSRPSWVAWVALGLSALSFVVAASVGILFAADRLGPSGSGDFFYDAGLPSWGSVDLTPTGAATELALTDSVTKALYDGVEDGMSVEDVLCEALPAPKKDSVATCSAVVEDLDSTVVLFFLDDDGGYLATLY